MLYFYRFFLNFYKNMPCFSHIFALMFVCPYTHNTEACIQCETCWECNFRVFTCG
jgi:hypothetical protein